MSESAKAGKQMAVSVRRDTVVIEIICAGDKYEAQVLYDDIIERMRSGEGVTIGVQGKSIEGTSRAAIRSR